MPKVKFTTRRGERVEFNAHSTGGGRKLSAYQRFVQRFMAANPPKTTKQAQRRLREAAAAWRKR